MTTRYPTQVFKSNHPWDVIRNNRIINDFLRSDCTVLAKMDIDQVYPPNYIERFMSLVDEYKVVGPLIKDRWEQSNFMPLAFKSYDGMELKRMNISKCFGVCEVPYPHTNMFYAREVLEKVKPPWYEAHQTEDGLDRSNHVDYTFIDKIHDAGYPTYIDFQTEVKHG